MGHEHEASFQSPLDFPTLERLLTLLKRPSAWQLLGAEQEGQTHVLRYAYVPGVPPMWGEDFLVYLSDQKLYVLLHTATGKQEQAVLGWLKDCLHTSGLFGLEFQEP